MDSKKYEQLINLIINEDEDKAKELFHEIVVEQSREIYESIMAEEMMDMEEEDMGGQVGDLLDEINAEEAGMTEDEEEFGSEEMDSGDDFEGEEVFDLDAEEEFGDEGEASEEVEDAVIRIEDKLDQLMAEFEELMGSEEGEMDIDSDNDESGEEEIEVDSEEEEVMEAVQLQKVSVTHGDDGAQKKSPGLQNSGQAGMDSKPVKFAGDAEAVPSSPKGPSNAYAKGESKVKGAGQFKNAPGHKSQDLSSAPKPVTKDGSAHGKSPVAK